jgi:hypothetical protein
MTAALASLTLASESEATVGDAMGRKAMLLS